MDPEIIEELRAANEACMTLLTLMTFEDGNESAAALVAEDPRYAERTTCMALAGFAIAAASALADAAGVSVETIIQTAATNAAMHTLELEELLNDEDENDEG